MTINWNARSYSKEQFINAWSTSSSIAETARKLSLVIYGSTYQGLRLAAKDCGLNETHMKGQAWSKGLRDIVTNKPKYSLDQLLKEDVYYNSNYLKKRLLSVKLLEEKCYAPFCTLSNPTINGFTGESESLRLALDHINGVHTDNRLENLRLLCYHCHGQTPTFAGKNNKTK